MTVLKEVISLYRVLVPTPVMYELAFGPDGSAGENEKQIWSQFHSPGGAIDLVAYRFASRSRQLASTGFMVVNPGYDEWWTARTRLLSHIGSSGMRPGKAKKEYSLDALIHATARNCFAPICTANMVDFEMLNKVASKVHHDGPVPIFHPESIAKSVSETVHYSFQA